ncbi:MAG: paraquat-inducible protein A, partial [Paracoccaceae bacterium]
MSAAVLTARAAGLVGCDLCDSAAPQGTRVCGQCGARLPEGGRRSLSAVWAWLVAGIVLYIPANLQPMLVTQQFGKAYPNTIVGGVIELFANGFYGIAAIVFFASVVIPVTKFFVIGRLALIASGRAPMAPALTPNSDWMPS